MAGATGHRRRVRPARLLVLVATAAALVLARPGPAGAHAELVSSEPAPGAQLDSAPPAVVLTFTESVEMPEDGVELLDATGERVDIPAPEHPGGDRSVVQVDLPDLDDGAYVVSWRIISEDSHPISGAFTFAVGDASVADAQAVAGDVEAGSGASDSLGIVFGIDRFVAFAGLVVLVGGIGFVLTLWPAGLDDRRARRIIAGAWGAAFLATAAGIALQAAYAEGGTPADAFDLGLVGDELGSKVARIWLVRLVLLVVVAAGARFATRSLAASRLPAGGEDGSAAPAPPRVPDEVTYVAAILGLAVLVTVSYAGHASSGRWVPLAMVADVVHLASVSAWLGGLTLLGLCVLRPVVTDGGPQSIAAIDRVVGRFSTVAFVSVVAIVASGVVQGWRQLGSVSALWDTTYGRLLVVKVVLVGLMLVAAALSRAWVRSHVGAPAPGAGDAAEPAPALSPGPGAVARGACRDVTGIRRSVMVEVAIAVLVLGVTAGLVESVPGRVEEAGEAGAPGAGRPYTAQEHGNDVLVNLTVDPTTVGPTAITVEAQNHDGTPAAPEEVQASLRLPERDLGPLTLTLEDQGDGVYTADAELPFPGAWELLVLVRTSDIDQDRFTTTFVVR
jgi:copper transport protein